MLTCGSTQNTQMVHLEVAKSFQKLSSCMDQLSDPDLVEHCKIWKHEKGAKKLIQLAIQGDRFIAKQTKNLKGVHEQIEAQDQAHLQQTHVLVNKLSSMKQESRKDIPPTEQNIKIEDRMSDSCSGSESFIESQEKLKKQEGNLRQDSQQIIFDSQSSYKNGSKKQQRLKKRYLRGPYKNYSREMKQKIVQLYRSNSLTVSKISSNYGVPIKNIKRWAQNGIDRKEGAGRKRLDPSMEKDLFRLIKQKFPPNTMLKINEIRYLALNLSRVEDFKASKGWAISFIERFNLGNIYQIIP